MQNPAGTCQPRRVRRLTCRLRVLLGFIGLAQLRVFQILGLFQRGIQFFNCLHVELIQQGFGCRAAGRLGPLSEHRVQFRLRVFFLLAGPLAGFFVVGLFVVGLLTGIAAVTAAACRTAIAGVVEVVLAVAGAVELPDLFGFRPEPGLSLIHISEPTRPY